MRIAFCVIGVLCLFPPFHVFAEETGKNLPFEERIRALEASNAELLGRLQAAEDSASALRTRFASLVMNESGRERVLVDSLLDEVREQDREAAEQIERLPVLSGYYDFAYANNDRRGDPGGFAQHRLSLHVSDDLDDFRMFSEVEFESGPLIEGDGGSEVETARGEIVAEQVWGEYVASSRLALRGGILLSPGYWNVNHYPNVVLSTRDPLMVEEIFPPTLVGIMAYGGMNGRKAGFTYQGYVSNGESPFFTREDNNENKALGGRFCVHLPAPGGFDLLDAAVSGYNDAAPHSEKTRVWGLDSEIRRGGLELLSEFAERSGAEKRRGFYAQPSVRFTPHAAVFYRYDFLHANDVRIEEHTAGVNFRPVAQASLKLEFYRSLPSDSDPFNAFAASLAIAF